MKPNKNLDFLISLNTVAGILTAIILLTNLKNLSLDFPIFFFLPLALTWMSAKVYYRSLYSAVINSCAAMGMTFWQLHEFYVFPKESILPLIHKYGLTATVFTVALAVTLGIILGQWKKTTK